MGNKSWKAHERRCASLIDGKRYPANMGGRADIEGPLFVGQCKEVKVLPLSKLTALVEEMDALAERAGKLGITCVKLRRGSGRHSPTLMVISDTTWSKLYARWAK